VESRGRGGKRCYTRMRKRCEKRIGSADARGLERPLRDQNLPHSRRVLCGGVRGKRLGAPREEKWGLLEEKKQQPRRRALRKSPPTGKGEEERSLKIVHRRGVLWGETSHFREKLLRGEKQHSLSPKKKTLALRGKSFLWEILHLVEPERKKKRRQSSHGGIDQRKNWKR